MRLDLVQHEFQDYVLRGQEAIAQRIEPGRRDDHRRRLAIYYDAYRLRLIDALAADYDALLATMGEQDCREACRAYIEATPSVFRNVRWYCGGLPAFLRETPPWCERPCLADIALFEWTLTLAFDAADEPPIHFEDLSALAPDAWGALGFRLHPSVQLIDLRANAPAIRKALDAGEPPPPPVLAETPVSWLIWRKDLSPHFRSLSQPEAWALRAARNGHAFAGICEGLCEWIAPEEAAAAAAAWLRTCVDDQLIAGLTKA